MFVLLFGGFYLLGIGLDWFDFVKPVSLFDCAVVLVLLDFVFACS